MNLTKFVLALLLFLFSSIPSFAQNDISATSTAVQASLGDGYDPKSQTFKGSCMNLGDSDIVWAGQQTSSIYFARAMSSTEAKESLGFGAKARAQYSVYTASAAAQFARSTSSDDYSESATYSAQVYFKNQKVKNPVLSQAARARSAIPSQFREMCGYEYVEQLQLGAALYINLKISFSNKEDRSSFATQVKVSGPLFSASAELSKAAQNFSKSGFVTVTLLQVGGDVSKLATIFSDATDGGRDAQVPSATSPLAIVNCSMSDLASCNKVLSAAMVYASNDLGKSFPSQISPGTNPVNSFGGPAVLHYLTKEWVTAGINLPNPILNQTEEWAKAELSKLINDQLKISSLMKSMAIARIRLSSAQTAKTAHAQEVLSNNIIQIVDAAERCYGDSRLCAGVVAGLTGVPGHSGSLIPISNSDLNIEPETFAQYCDLVQSEYYSKKVGNTVNALMDVAQNQLGRGNLYNYKDPCGYAETLLVKMDKIEMPFKSIVDLAPMQNLTQLKYLYLNANPIEKLDLLSSFKELSILNLNNTFVSDVSALMNLKHLRSIQLNGTRTLGKEDQLRKQFPAASLSFTDNEVCRLERTRLFNDRAIKLNEFNRLESSNLAPIFSQSGLRSSGVNFYVSCEEAAYYL